MKIEFLTCLILQLIFNNCKAESINHLSHLAESEKNNNQLENSLKSNEYDESGEYYQLHNNNRYKITKNILGQSMFLKRNEHLENNKYFEKNINKEYVSAKLDIYYKQSREKNKSTLNNTDTIDSVKGRSKIKDVLISEISRTIDDNTNVEDSVVFVNSDYSFMDRELDDEYNIEDGNEGTEDGNDLSGEHEENILGKAQNLLSNNINDKIATLKITNKDDIQSAFEKEFRKLELNDVNTTQDALKYSLKYYNEFIRHQSELHEENNEQEHIDKIDLIQRQRKRRSQWLYQERDSKTKTIQDSRKNKLGDANSAPLFLTPYIYSGNYLLAQDLSYVKPFLGNIRSHSGYLTVDNKYHSNIFFWFFPCEVDFEKKPVLLWLQGGPGSSSLFGLFYENGPYKIVNDRIYRNKHTWSKHYNVLYIDNPVGTGFSFTTEGGYTRNQTIIGQHLYEALKQLFLLFPNLKDNDFYIAGESYAGKYIPSIAYEIHNRNLLTHFKINLKGLFIGNGIVDPISMFHYSEYLYNIGLLDEYQRKFFEDTEQRIKLLIRLKKWRKASTLFMDLFDDKFMKMTGFTQYYNLRGLDFSSEDFDRFLEDDKARDQIHVGNIKFNDGDQVYRTLLPDITRSVIDKVNILVENYKIVFYYGQLDMICPYSVSVPFFSNIEYSHAYDYYETERKIWTLELEGNNGDNVVGFIKESHNLVEVLVRNAGHMSPRDQPLVILDLLKKFIQ